MSAELFEVLSLAARYLFALLGVLIVLRAFLWLLSDGATARSGRRRSRDSGCIGEMVVLSGSPALPEGTIIPVPWEGSLGSVRSCDVVVPCQGVRRRHLWFSWEDGSGLKIQPLSGCEVSVDQLPVDCRSWRKSSPMVHGSFLQIGSALLRLRVFAGLDSAAGFPEDAAAFGAVGMQQSPLPPSPGVPAGPDSGLSDPVYTDQHAGMFFPPAPPYPGDPGQGLPSDPAAGLSPVFPSGSPVSPGQQFPPYGADPFLSEQQPAGADPVFSDRQSCDEEPLLTGRRHPYAPDSASSAPRPSSRGADPAPRPARRRRSQQRNDRWEEDWSE